MNIKLLDKQGKVVVKKYATIGGSVPLILCKGDKLYSQMSDTTMKEFTKGFGLFAALSK